MSLVEQAMTRLRRPGESAGEGAVTQPVAAPIAERAGEPVRNVKQLTVDVNLLRARGYLPEEDKDRQFADEYRKIKRPLIRKALAGPSGGTAADPRLIMVTSALPGDGKTFTSVNLAFSLARERDISVVLVDADLPKPHVSRIFGVQQERGLTDALVDETLSVESLVIQSNVRGFSILPAGASEEGSSELLSSNRMRQLVKNLCNNNPRRIVLLDSPPLLITTEGPALVNVSGQVVLVIRAGLTPRRAVLDAIAMIDVDRAGGIVLNEAQMGVMHGYYGYGNYGDAASPKP